MKKLIDLIQEELVKAFTAAEMDPSYARAVSYTHLGQHPRRHRIPEGKRCFLSDDRGSVTG